jgi:inosine-uridine nucleoside N-ribohydrolase
MFEAIQQQYSSNPQQGPVQLIATGALSNVALLLLLYPEVKPLIEITIMGGALGVSILPLVVMFCANRQYSTACTGQYEHACRSL